MGKKVYVSKQDRLRCPTVNCVFNIHDNEGVNILTKLHLQFSALNEHRCRHRFKLQVQVVRVEQLMRITNTSSCTALVQ